MQGSKSGSAPTKSGSVEVWDELFKSRDLSYSEKPDSQGKLFELIKVAFLEKLFQKYPTPYTLTPKTLEIGCGTAFVSLYFAKRGFEVTCLDTSKEVLAVAEKNFKSEGQSGKFIVGNAEKLPFKDNSFDIVMSFGLLEHFSDPKQAILEMVRVLKPGGLFFADIVPARFSVQSLGNLFNSLVVLGFWLVVKGQLKTAWQKFIHSYKPEYYENSFSWREYRAMMIESGLWKVEVGGNRPVPRLTLPKSLDSLYAYSLQLIAIPWSWFDNYGGSLARWWGAGWWFWGTKSR